MKEQLIATLEVSRDYTLSVAEKMPGDAYNFKPKGAGWNFGELLDHIAYGIRWWKENHIDGTETEWNPPASAGAKKDIMENLDKAYKLLENTISQLKPDDKSVQGFHSTIDHITHHRGQAVAYMRCNGIEPPEYKY